MDARTHEVESSRWGALALLALAQFMVVLDATVVNVALPSIQADLGFSRGGLQWVVSAYALALGGFLLLGGRAADLLGRRRMLVAGLGLFALASLVAGLAWDERSLVGARGLQGLAAAVVSPASLSLLTTMFREGRERDVALGVWAAVGGLGAAAGGLLGGVLADTVGWEWAFFVNLPMAATAIALAPVLLRESWDDRERAFDLPGAVLVTAGLSAAVFSISRAGEWGWASMSTLGGAGAALALLVAFVATELRVSNPLLSFGILRSRTLQAASLAALLVTATVSSMFLLLTLYLQQVLGFSPMRAGLAYLAIFGTSVVWATVASRVVTRVGPRPLLTTGLTLLALGLAWFARLPAQGTYVRDLLPGFLVVAAGMGLSFVSVNTAALSCVGTRDAGIVSGLLGVSQQIGAALGIAVLTSIALVHADAASADGAPAGMALGEGLRAAFSAGTVVALAALAVSLLLLRGEPAASERVPGCADQAAALPAAA